jgi:hypothetical protein
MANCYRILKKRVDDPDTVCMVGTESIKITRKYLNLVDDFCKTFDFDPEQFVLDAPQSPKHPQHLIDEWSWAIIPILEIIIGFEFFALTEIGRASCRERVY